MKTKLVKHCVDTAQHNYIYSLMQSHRNDHKFESLHQIEWNTKINGVNNGEKYYKP